jgi:hypothetical protein
MAYPFAGRTFTSFVSLHTLKKLSLKKYTQQYVFKKLRKLTTSCIPVE